MNPKTAQFLVRYRKALRAHLRGLGPPDALVMARLAKSATVAKVKAIELAQAHLEGMLEHPSPKEPPATPADRARRALKGSWFFAAVLHPDHGPMAEAARRKVRVLSAQTVEMAAENHSLREEVALRRVTETILRANEANFNKTLQQAEACREQMRELLRQLLVAQEDERKKLSRELNDVVAQSLTSINIRLAALRKEASIYTKSLSAKIALAQRLVLKSTRTIHRFACELRPAVLDDIGLIPALKGAISAFKAQTGLSTHLRSFPEVESLPASCRTVFFRVAQEALANVARHAEASKVAITLSKHKDGIRMEVRDNGKSFEPGSLKTSGPARQLGLLGMQERLEMVGGMLQIQASIGHGTRIIATIPNIPCLSS